MDKAVSQLMHCIHIFHSLGVPHSKKLSAAKADMFSIKDGVLTPPEEKKMRNVLAMEIPLENGDNFRSGVFGKTTENV